MATDRSVVRWTSELRTLLVLGRVSNLPTVWSNCLAGWILSGGGTFTRFGLLCLGSSCLYVGGMFLNDAFDAEFDAQHRVERPIPSGAISLAKVWGWGLGWLVAGILILSLLNSTTLVLSLLLATTIVVYDAIHKAITLSPLLMALCRFQLYLVASAAARHGLAGMAVWSGLVLGLYVVGLSYMARGERIPGAARYWPCCLVAAPLGLAWLANPDEYRWVSLWLSFTMAIWVLRSLSKIFWSPSANIGQAVSGLLAGICLVDMLAINGKPLGAALSILLLFGLALLAQRFVPAT